MVHAITWISIAVLVLAFLFFIASIIILEYGVKLDQNGEIIIPWYYWVFFVGAGLLFLAYVIMLAFPDKTVNAEKKDKEMQAQQAQAQQIMSRSQQYPISSQREQLTTSLQGVPESKSSHYDQHSPRTHGQVSFAANDPSVRPSTGKSGLESLGRRSYLQ